MWILTTISAVALVAALASLLLAAVAFSNVRARHRHPDFSKRLGALESDLLICQDDIGEIGKQVRKVYNRERTRKAREAKLANGRGSRTAGVDGETDAEWKARMEREYALTGKIGG